MLACLLICVCIYIYFPLLKMRSVSFSLLYVIWLLSSKVDLSNTLPQYYFHGHIPEIWEEEIY